MLYVKSCRETGTRPNHISKLSSLCPCSFLLCIRTYWRTGRQVHTPRAYTRFSCTCRYCVKASNTNFTTKAYFCGISVRAMCNCSDKQRNKSWVAPVDTAPVWKSYRNGNGALSTFFSLSPLSLLRLLSLFTLELPASLMHI